MGLDLVNNMIEIRNNPRPGVVNALVEMRIDGEPAPDLEILGNLGLVIGGGFDTTTALTAHSLEWLVGASRRARTAAAATATPCSIPRPKSSCATSPRHPAMAEHSPTTSRSTELNSKRVSGCGFRGPWPTATPQVFREPDTLVLDRKGNRHFSFGIGVHRCVGSNVARTVFKSMLTAVLDRMPDYHCDPDGPSTTRPSVSSRACGSCRPPSHPAPRSAPASTRPWTSCNASATSRNSPGPSPNAKKLQ